MCKSKAEGGKRCASHSPANRRLKRAAKRETIRLTKRDPGGLSLHDLGIDNIEPAASEITREPAWAREFDRKPFFNPSGFVTTYGSYSLVLDVLGEHKSAPLHALIAWAPTGEDLSEDQAMQRINSPSLSGSEYSEVTKFLRTFSRDSKSDPDALRNLTNKGIIISKGEIPLAVFHAAGNPSTPSDALESLAACKIDHDAKMEVFAVLGGNPSTPTNVLRDMAAWGQDSREAMSRIEENPTTPVDVLEYLANPTPENREKMMVIWRAERDAGDTT